MSTRSTVHDTFVIERKFAFEPALVFAAWSSGEAKSHWFVGPSGWETLHRELEFRVGGRERLVGRRPDGKISSFDAHYYDIVPDERIVYVYEMRQNDVRISVSLATVEFKGQRGETRLVITEQGVFIDDFDDARGREQGTRVLIDQLARALSRVKSGSG